VMHLAFLFHKRYVWCPTTNAPFLHVDFGVPVTAKGWSEHKLVGSGDKDPTESLTASSISRFLTQQYISVLHMDPSSVEICKKNQGNRRDGVNLMARQGAQAEVCVDMSAIKQLPVCEPMCLLCTN